MNKITILAAVAALSVAATSLYADDTHHPEKAQQSTSAPEATVMEQSTNPGPVTARQMGQAQETMHKLQELMGKIRQTRDPKERRKLMQEHMQAMQEGLKQLHDMGGSMMGNGDGGKQGGMMMEMGAGGKTGGGMMMGDMMKMHNMMEMRMEMMATMMEQMMQREEIRDAMSAK